ncbi:MAG: four helix bundle protein [Arenicellales bacterium]|nr:four helix bundle protein [Arenicellales bacterium]
MDAVESLRVWQRSFKLSVKLYLTLKNSQEFAFRDQVTRAGLSVPSNIAEGFERNSKKEFIRFLRIAKGSCEELRTQLQIGKAVGFIETENADEMIDESIEISKMIQGLIKSHTQ